MYFVIVFHFIDSQLFNDTFFRLICCLYKYEIFRSETIPVCTINRDTLKINKFPELEEEDINALICSCEEELNNEDLLELNQNQHYDKFQDGVSEKPNEKVLTVKGLSKVFQLIETMKIQIMKDFRRLREMF